MINKFLTFSHGLKKYRTERIAAGVSPKGEGNEMSIATEMRHLRWLQWIISRSVIMAASADSTVGQHY